MGAYSAIDSAIAQFEGYNTPGTIANRQNNPGNIMFGPFAQAHGATGAGTGGIAVFPDVASGQAATDALVSSYALQGFSIQDLINKWSPPNAPGNTPESTANYTAAVASAAGVPASTPLTTLQTGADLMGMIPGWTGSNLPSLVPGGTDTSQASGLLSGKPSTFSWQRIAAFVLGLILIAGGLFLLKPVQNITATAARLTA